MPIRLSLCLCLSLILAQNAFSTTRRVLGPTAPESTSPPSQVVSGAFQEAVRIEPPPSPLLAESPSTEEPTGLAARPISEQVRAVDGPIPLRGQPEIVQSGDVRATESSQTYRAEVARIKAQGEVVIPMRNTPLHAAIRAIATHANLNYIAPDEEAFPELVTLRFEGDAWQMLTVLKRRYGFEADFADGLWTFFRQQPGELIVRTYELRNTNLSEITSSGGGGGAQAQPASTQAGLASGGDTGSSGGGAAVFSSDSQKLLDEIKALLGLPITGIDIQVHDGDMPMRASRDSGKTVAQAKAEVFFLEDSNKLFVVATRQQHKYIEEYLKTADAPQTLIRIDAQLVETARDPRSFIGIDPSGYARPTLSLKDGGGTVTNGTGAGTGSTSGSTSSGLSTPSFDMGDLGSAAWPSSVVLSSSAMTFQMSLLAQDATSKIVSRPRMVTTNNRQVSIESVIEEPYASAQTNNSFAGTAGSSGQTTTQLERIKIGTTINVLPRVMQLANGERVVHLNLVMTVSGKVVDKAIYGQLVPVTSSRVYRYSLHIPDGHTLAIGGLDETAIADSVNKVPLAGDIPLMGYLFKGETKSNTSRNLIAYITPTIIDPDNIDSGDLRQSQTEITPSVSEAESNYRKPFARAPKPKK